MSDLLKRQLIKHEGLKLKPYVCTAGMLTIGVGRNLVSTGITEKEAEYLLMNDIARIRRVLINEPLYVKLNQPRKDVLANMAFQMGIDGLAGFQRMFIAIMNDAYRTASAEMINSKWAEQTPARALELAEQMRTGEYRV